MLKNVELTKKYSYYWYWLIWANVLNIVLGLFASLLFPEFSVILYYIVIAINTVFLLILKTPVIVKDNKEKKKVITISIVLSAFTIIMLFVCAVLTLANILPNLLIYSYGQYAFLSIFIVKFAYLNLNEKRELENSDSKVNNNMEY